MAWRSRWGIWGTQGGWEDVCTGSVGEVAMCEGAGSGKFGRGSKLGVLDEVSWWKGEWSYHSSCLLMVVGYEHWAVPGYCDVVWQWECFTPYCLDVLLGTSLAFKIFYGRVLEFAPTFASKKFPPASTRGRLGIIQKRSWKFEKTSL
jgi:hypothetical protein